MIRPIEIVAAGWAGVICMFLPLGGAYAETAPARTALPDRPRMTAVRIDTPPEIDGHLDEAVWQQGALIDGLRQEIPVAYGVPTQKTEVRIMYDENFLYLGVRAHDREPEKIIARKMLRDESMTSDDRVSFNIDTLGDQRNGYYFQINPLGNKRDGLIENSTAKFDWDGIWYAAGSIDAGGYVVEVAIPFKTLSIDPSKTSWGLQVFRGIKRHNETNRWASPTPNLDFFNMAGAGYLDGIRGIDQGIGLDVVPNAVVTHLDEGTTNRNYTRFDPGFDAFYKILPALTGSVTVNTDFGEAEVDARQVNLTRFSLFFPEKRRFFLQDEGIFDFGGLQRNPLPFFSRRIGLSDQGEPIDIIAGGKVTGRVGRFNIGLLDVATDAYTRESEAGDPVGQRPERIDTQNLAVARISANVLEESTAGVIFTHGDPNSNQDNLIYGLDLNYRNSNILPDRTLIGRVWGQGGRTEGVGSNEYAWGTRLEYPNDRVFWRLIAEEVGENFFPALGFTSRTGIRNYHASYRYRVRPEQHLRTVDTEVSGTFVTDNHNNVESGSLNVLPFALTNPAGDLFLIRYARLHERLAADFAIQEGVVVPVGEYDWNRYEVELLASDARPLSARLIVRWADFFEGERLDIIPSITWRPSKHFLLALAYERNDVDLDDGDFVVHLASARINFLFTPMLSWTTLVQYDNVTDTIGINSRVRWIIRPGSELFVVLNQGLIVDHSRIRRGETEPRIKLSWTFRF
jgi:hypothetical protein